MVMTEQQGFKTTQNISGSLQLTVTDKNAVTETYREIFDITLYSHHMNNSHTCKTKGCQVISKWKTAIFSWRLHGR